MTLSSPIPWLAPTRCSIPHGMYYAMRKHVITSFPEEACGLLAADRAGEVKRHFKIENILHSSTRYRFNPQQQVDAMLWMDVHACEQMIIYHSHPDGPDHLSVTDLSESYYPTALYLLWYLLKIRWKSKLYRIENGSSIEIPLIII